MGRSPGWLNERTQIIEKPWYECDQCGYAITGCTTEADVAESNVLLSVRGQTYHFHGGYAVYGDANKECAVWDESRSCLSRWLTAHRHREAAEAAKGVEA